VSDGLRAHPVLNASVRGNEIIYRKQINIGIAVALDWGLIVPVIKQADNLSLTGLTRTLNDLANRARSKRLDPREVQDGTFTITNPGVFGSLIGTPIINQPQVGILCIGAIEKRPKVITGPDGEDTIAIRTCCYLSLSFDHRIVDGADADKFMSLRQEESRDLPRNGAVKMGRALTIQRTLVTPPDRERFHERLRRKQAYYEKANCRYWAFEELGCRERF
jgi:2-oxoglutarate dehydrogenase E2 component (dihydrolipoamide succinyltransferase)